MGSAGRQPRRGEHTQGHSNGGAGAAERSGSAQWCDPRVLDAVERQSAVLVRNFEMLRRRTDIYSQLDRAEYLLLRTLAEIGPADINTLACAVGLDPSTAGRQVAAMEQDGFVAREPDPDDRRRAVITPTREGRRRMDTVRVNRQRNLEQLLDGWSPSELDALAASFTKYNKAVADRYLASVRGGS
ncbi:MAG: MarR family winged helix-turn-helix transcriptional regulator [Sciscionella sp.]